MRPTIIFYPNETKKSKKNGKIPLYMRVLFNGQKAEARPKRICRPMGACSSII
jgi:hypothetical protein